mgnify:CR=1 FL=1
MGKYHDRINWKKELQLLPGYIIVCAWVALTAAILFWIVCASLSSTKEILTGRVMDFSNGLKWDNYVTAWNTQNVSLYFFNSLVYCFLCGRIAYFRARCLCAFSLEVCRR